MTTEPTQPAVEAGEAPAGTSASSHRRRRRRRKNRGAGNPAEGGAFNASAAASSAPGTAQTGTTQAGTAQPGSAQEAPSQQSSGGPQRILEGGSFKSNRRKKRRAKQQQNGGFRPEPGNSILPTNGYQGKRKQARGKGPREFVGPMDHSYRGANGNVADGPPATIAQAGNGNFYSEAPSRRTPAAAVSPDSPTRIFLVIEDLFFVAKIQEVSRKLGVKVEFVKGDKDIVSHLAEVADPEHASLVVFDLNNAAVKSLTLIPKLKSKLKKSISVIGFLSHIQGDLKIKAIEAGCDTVMPRSAFSQSLPNLLRRYGIDDDDEYYPQPM